MAGFTFQTFQNPSGNQQAATAGAYQASQAAMRDALATVQPGRFVGSPFAQGLLNRYLQSPGMSPETMAAHRRQVSRQAAQSEAGELQAARQAAAAGGFGFSRGGGGKMEADIRARSADTVQQSMDRLLIGSEDQARAQEAQALAAYMQLYGIEGGLAAQYANLQANRQFPVIPGVTPEAYGMPGQQAGPGGPMGGPGWTGGTYTGACPPGYIPGAGGVGCVPSGAATGGPYYGGAQPIVPPPGYSPSGGRIYQGSSPTPGSILMRLYGQ